MKGRIRDTAVNLNKRNRNGVMSVFEKVPT